MKDRIRIAGKSCLVAVIEGRAYLLKVDPATQAWTVRPSVADPEAIVRAAEELAFAACTPEGRTS
jgi:hypothetical protein